MICNPTYNYLDLDNTDTNELTITTPMSNYFTIQFFKADEITLMSNVPEYSILLNFDFDD